MGAAPVANHHLNRHSPLSDAVQTPASSFRHPSGWEETPRQQLGAAPRAPKSPMLPPPLSSSGRPADVHAKEGPSACCPWQVRTQAINGYSVAILLGATTIASSDTSFSFHAKLLS